jgi:WD40 repeat protein
MRTLAVLLALLTASAEAQPHLVFDRKIGNQWPDDNRWMNFVAFRADGQFVAANGDGLRLWTFPDGQYVRGVAGETLAISADFRYLTTEKSILDLQSGKIVYTVSGKQDLLLSAAFSVNDEYVAVRSSPHLTKGAQITVLKTADASKVSAFGTRYAAALAFSPDNQTLATGHWNNVTLWDVRTGARLALLMSPPPPSDAISYNRDGRYIYGLAFSRDGTLLAAGSDNAELQIWDVAARKLLHTLKIGGSDVSNPAFSPDGKLLAAGTYGNGTVYLVDVASGKILSQVQVSMFGCGAVAFSPDGRYLITPSNSGLLDNGKHTQGGTIHVFRVEN